MKTYSVLAVICLAFGFVSHGATYEELKADILADVASTNREARLAVTNRVDGLISLAPSTEETNTCKLIKARVLSECADITGEEEIYDGRAYGMVTNLCWSVLQSSLSRPDSWQRYGSVFCLVEPLSMDGRHETIFGIATNALAAADSQNAVSVDTHTWTVLFGAESLQLQGIKEHMRTLAAVSLSMSDRNADISAYTNGLPTRLLEVIRAIRGQPLAVLDIGE